MVFTLFSDIGCYYDKYYKYIPYGWTEPSSLKMTIVIFTYFQRVKSNFVSNEYSFV